jgi:hypothetical protein
MGNENINIFMSQSGQVTVESGTQKTINPILSYQVEKQDLLKSEVPQVQKKEKEVNIENGSSSI